MSLVIVKPRYFEHRQTLKSICFIKPRFIRFISKERLVTENMQKLWRILYL